MPTTRFKYSVNDNFFSKDSDDALYWAGFFAADGCIYKRTINLFLANIDKSHVEKFVKAMGYTGNIHTNNKTKSCGVQITSPQIIKDLNTYNVVPRKSLSYKFPKKALKSKYLNSFIRGYFDGDGCVGLAKNKKDHRIISIMVSFSGTKAFLKVLRKVLIIKCGFNKTKIIKDKGIFRLSYGGKNQSKVFFDFLYKGSSKSTRLDRKYEKFFTPIETMDKLKKCMITNIVTGKKIKFNSATELAKYLNVAKTTGQRFCRDRETRKNLAFKYI